jgi:hypothetical protein
VRVIPYDGIYQGVYDNTYRGLARWLWLRLTGRLRDTERAERRAAVRRFILEQRELRRRTERAVAGNRRRAALARAPASNAGPATEGIHRPPGGARAPD